MANNQLIQGAKATGKKFLDVGAAVAGGFDNKQRPVNPRVAINKEIQSRVNGYMSKMKTDMDFTNFSPEETATMRDFLIGKRKQYTDAAKMVAQLSDSTSPEYMKYVDIMNGVNNSFTNLSKQLGTFKEGKVQYAEGQEQNIFSKGTTPSLAEQTASIYGFGENKAPFNISENGSLGFNVNGEQVDYNDMAPLGLKDYKLGLQIINDNEAAYKQGMLQNANSLDAYSIQLQEAIRTPDQIQSMIFDFNSNIKTDDLQDAITNGDIDIQGAKTELIKRLVNSRNEVSQKGYNEKLAVQKAKLQASDAAAAKDRKDANDEFDRRLAEKNANKPTNPAKKSELEKHLFEQLPAIQSLAAGLGLSAKDEKDWIQIEMRKLREEFEKNAKKEGKNSKKD